METRTETSVKSAVIYDRAVSGRVAYTADLLGCVATEK